MSPDRRLTHVELLYRPGERELAARVLRLLGCEPVDRGGHWFTSFVDPASTDDWATNVLYASEVGEEQQAFEAHLAASPAVTAFVAASRSCPQKTSHFGFRVRSSDELDGIVERVRSAGADDPELAGRVAVDGVYRPGEPDAVAPNMVQAFVWTDVVVSGLHVLGQHIEVQWHLTATDGAGRPMLA